MSCSCVFRSSRRFFPVTLALAVVTWVTSSALAAEDPPAGNSAQPAAKPTPKAPKPKKEPFQPVPVEGNLDYFLQGEYRGWQRSRPSSRSSEPVALQVFCPTPGEFAAVKFYGGLPGQGWQGGERFDYVGQREGETVRLVADDYEIVVDGKTASVFTRDGRPAGELKKVDRVSPTEGLRPPRDAIILFDGRTPELLVDAKLTPDRDLLAGTITRDAYGDCRLHLEFRIPFVPHLSGQNRGNSGVYLQSRYELQILESFGRPAIFNECGSLYRTLPPRINMCYPPYRWQTYDIDFSSAKFDDHGKKIADMKISVWHNGVPIHQGAVLFNKTGNGSPEGPLPLPTKLQDHNSPVEFRNIWLVPKDPSETRPGATSAHQGPSTTPTRGQDQKS
ncbi:3-keto-disaccharide hydrolase [Planctomicrobium sp. SH664]|uniref:3-keto-disaccharide hydrolase n=1 Tax=Planctomicrobium sp. SH664 TaxID=3448125 RepID=UPI003F5B8D2A